MGKIFRRPDLTGVFTLAFPGVAVGPPAPASSGGMLLDLTSINYFSNNRPFLNWWRQGGGGVTVNSTLNGTVSSAAAWYADGTASVGGGAAYFNASTGDLNNPCPSDVTSINRTIFTATPYYNVLAGITTPWWSGQTLYVTWTGTSTPSTASGTLGTGGSLTVTGPNSATVVLGANVTDWVLGFTVTNYDDPPQNINVYQSQYAANVTAGQIFNPDYINDVKQFGVLRIMDMQRLGGACTGASDISQLADANYNCYTGDFAGLAGGFTGTISGTTLTILAGPYSGGSLAQGMGITGASVSANTVILSGSGSTWTVNNSQTVASETMTGVAALGSYYGPVGSKGGVHPSLACALANLCNVNIHYCIPPAMTNSGMTAIAEVFEAELNDNLYVIFEYANEPWNPGAEAYRYFAAVTYAGTGAYSGYRAAQLWQLVNAVYGSGGRSRWKGALSGQFGDYGTDQSNVYGAQYWIANGADGPTLTELCDYVIIAPYMGDFVSSQTITAVTTGTTTTITAPNSYSVGEVVRLFFSNTAAGTIGALLNNQDVAVASLIGSSPNYTGFTFTNYGGNSGSGAASTSGLTYSGTSYAANGALFDLMDDSLANFTSNPSTYPTKYTYFAEQVFKSLITGSSDNGYTTGSNFSSGINQLYIAQAALVANTYGLQLRFYEGGINFGIISDANLDNNTQAVDYCSNWQYDTSPTGLYTAATLYEAYYNACAAAYSAYPAQFQEASQPTQGDADGIWCSLRYYPGDESNAKWSAITAINALGPYVDPTAPATGAYSTVGNGDAAAGSGPINFTAACGSNAAGIISVGAYAQAGTILGVTAGGVALGVDIAASNGLAIIYSGPIAANAGNVAISISYSGALNFDKGGVAFLIQSPVSTTKQTTVAGADNVTISETKGSAIIAMATNTTSGELGAGDANSIAPTISVAPGGTTQGIAVLFNVDFSSQIFNIGGGHGDLVVATYR